jgi:hypothetical protein
MEAPKVEERNGFWESNKGSIASIVIILVIMFFLKYLFNIALQTHLV